MKFGIVTPSYNQGAFLEETIDSVLSQGYPHLEYVIIDGGSSDQSVEIIRKYEKHLAFWVSEKDDGQSHAINKGLRRLRADVWAYLNSDDTYVPGTFLKVARAFSDPDTEWVTGHGIYVDSVGHPVRELIPAHDWSVNDVLANVISSPTMAAVEVSNFMRKSILEKFGYFDESLHYCMDLEYGLRIMLAGLRPVVIDEVLAKARLHQESKTAIEKSSGQFTIEKVKILERLCDKEERVVDHRSAMLHSLWIYRRQEVLSRVWNAWRSGGRLSALRTWVHAVAGNPSLIAHRPALGLLRRIITGTVK